MTIAIWIVAISLIGLGLVGLVLPVIPGPLLLFAGLLAAAWAEAFAFVGPVTLVSLGILAVVATVADFVAGAFGARHYGASSRSVFGAILGAIIGVFFGLIGLLVGPFIGALLGELTARSNLARSSRAGWGAVVGLALGTAAKVAIGIAMVGIFLLVRFI